MYKRLRYLRKDILKLTLKEFGKKIGMSPSAISDIESNKSGFNNRNIMLVHSIFNVNEDWLRFGTGDIFIEKNNINPLDNLKLDNLEYSILETYLSLDDTSRVVIKNYIKDFVNDFNNKQEITINDNIKDINNDNTFLAIAHDKKGDSKSEYITFSDKQLEFLQNAENVISLFDKKKKE